MSFKEWIAKRIVRYFMRRNPMLKKLKAGLVALASNTSERTAIIAVIAVKGACLVPNVCPILTTAAGYIDMTPDALVGAMLTYALLRFSSKVQKAPSA